MGESELFNCQVRKVLSKPIFKQNMLQYYENFILTLLLKLLLTCLSKYDIDLDM